MPNKHYQAGRRFEYRIKKYLEEKGYLCFRTAGSHSSADIIAFRQRQDALNWYVYNKYVYLIQAKHGTATIPRKKIVEFTRQADNYGFIPVLCTSKKGKLHFTNLMNLEDIDL